MTDIEALVRESLKSAPTPPTHVADPVAVIGRRAARARAFLAAGAIAAVAVVTAAIVVPLQVIDRAAAPIKPAINVHPTTSHEPQEWFKGGSQLVAAGDGFLWHLRRDPASNSGQGIVDELDPVTHHRLGSWKVDAPADFMAFGLGRVWVWGGGDGAYAYGLLQSVDPATGVVTRQINSHTGYNGVAFAAGRAWATAGRDVWQIAVSSDGVAFASRTSLPADTAQLGIIATDDGQLWVRAGRSWARIDTRSHTIADTVPWDGWMLGSAGGSSIWTTDAASRLVALDPALLHQGQSVAEGVRIQLPGPATAVAGSVQTGLFVVAYAGSDLSEDKNASLYYLSPREFGPTLGKAAKWPSVPGAHPYQLAADGTGGVNYSDQDSAWRWVP